MAELADISDALESLASRQNRYGKYRDAVKLTQRNEVRERCANTLPRGRTTQEVARREHSINSPIRFDVSSQGCRALPVKHRPRRRLLGMAEIRSAERLRAVPAQVMATGDVRAPGGIHPLARFDSGWARDRSRVQQPTMLQPGSSHRQNTSGECASRGRPYCGQFAAHALSARPRLRSAEHEDRSRQTVVSSVPRCEQSPLSGGAPWQS